MYGRRSFLRRGLGLLSGGAAGVLGGGLAAASGPTEAHGAPGASPPGAEPGNTGRRSIIEIICDVANLAPTECEPWLERPPTPSEPQSVLQAQPMLTVYGRSFGVAPILGMLGALNSFDELERGVAPWVSAMSDLAEAPVKVAPHLIYGLARPCHSDDDSCMIFLDASGVDLIEDYIKPAADRNMAVILDSQLGRLSPTYFIRRMIDAGYLAYPNVHVALDPEFATQPDQDMPGHPIGTLSAYSINEVQALLASYVREEGLSHKKVLIVHQFVDDLSDAWSMVPGKQNIEVYPEVELVFDADGFGSPNAKVHKYNAITDPTAYPQLEWRGIKIFQHNPHAPRFSDTPVMTPRQIYGLDPTPAGWRIWAPPHLVVVA
ncbi:MAG: hypothetical protein OXG43_04230 [Chloroflexi bacterium]|nr:hypothetical protein [Chloroflexota bacterium]